MLDTNGRELHYSSLDLVVVLAQANVSRWRSLNYTRPAPFRMHVSADDI